ncbi:MAG: rhodanese-like domain-containing protein [Coriobacteriales bacterium]|nr:rhodanese-like domain-containing protein [Coriobacteriales bacterium]
MTPQEAKSIMDSGEAFVLVDVRSLAEFQSGHIRNAQVLPVETIQEKAAGSLPDKDAKILVYCASGARSANAASILTRLGYTDVHNFGGLMQWPYSDMIV